MKQIFKTKSLIQLVILLPFLVIVVSSCNKIKFKDAKKVYELVKPHLDDIARGGKNLALNRYLTIPEQKASIAFINRLPIYRFEGPQFSTIFSNAVIEETQLSFQRDYYAVLRNVLNLINSKNVYHNSLNSEIAQIVNQSKKYCENGISYSPSTGILEIKTKSNYTQVRFWNVIIDSTVTTFGYYQIKN